jgi:hypothetical protein
MKKDIEAICDTWIRISEEVLTREYGGKWTPEYDSLLCETARKLIHNLDFTYRHDPKFRIKANLSNLMDDGLQPGTEETGEKIRKIVIQKFSEFKENTNNIL